jgi:hypothetical protein
MNGSLNHVFQPFFQSCFDAFLVPLEVHDELKSDGRTTRGCLVPVDLTTF